MCATLVSFRLEGNFSQNFEICLNPKKSLYNCCKKPFTKQRLENCQNELKVNRFF